MIFINAALASVLTIISVHSWRQDREIKFFYLILCGFIVALISVWAHLEIALIPLARVVLGLLFVAVGWVHWQKYKDTIYLAMFISGLYITLSKIYVYIFKESVVHGTGLSDSTNNIVLMLTRVAVAITVIVVILMRNRRGHK